MGRNEAVHSLAQDAQKMQFDPATGCVEPKPNTARDWRVYHGAAAWLFDPWTGRRRDARDVGSDVFGLLIVPSPVVPHKSEDDPMRRH